MPAGRLDQTLYLGPFSNVEAMNVTTLYKPGELGSQIQTTSNKAYQLVQLDSGATAATSAGTPVAGHLAYWKSRANYIVTNDKAQCENPGNLPSGASVAGIFCSLTSGAAGTATITAGNYGVIQQRGTHVGVYSVGVTAAAGDQLTANTAAATAGIAKFTPGTAATAPVIAVATAATGAVTANYTPARIGGADLIDVP